MYREKHKEVMIDFLEYLNKQSNNYILKGGTALMTCYNLDRFSEDIDLDSTDKESISAIIQSYCDSKGYDAVAKKDTDTVKRFTIHYDENEKPLKVEVSYRKREIDPDDVEIINGVKVYNINELALQKSNAYSGRDKIRDLYDLTFITNNYWDDLNKEVKKVIQNTVEYKGLEHFDFIIKDQSDELIDNNKLAGDFLSMFDKLNLITNSVEQEEEISF